MVAVSIRYLTTGIADFTTEVLHMFILSQNTIYQLDVQNKNCFIRFMCMKQINIKGWYH